MPVYEYECKECKKIFEVQQKINDEPLKNCPDCQAPVKKLMSMSSFQLKGGGWYADGYTSSSASSDKEKTATKATTKTEKPAASCPDSKACKGCAASATA